MFFFFLNQHSYLYGDHKNLFNVKRDPGTGEMTHQLRALAALTEDPGTVLHTHMAAHSRLELQFQGFQCKLLISVGTRQVHGSHTCIQARHKKNLKLKITFKILLLQH